jgi:hypothetical protein
MKKLTFISAFLCLTILSCQKADKAAVTTEPEAAMAERQCASYELLQQKMAADPAYREKLNAIEAFTQRSIRSGLTERVSQGSEITIPVVFHVVYNTPQENISDAQIASQIDVLNEDFNLRNQDQRLVPSYFKDLKADVGIHFKLDRIIRVQNNRKQWSVGYGDENVKYSAKGGSDVVDPTTYLNIWVCNLGSSLLGYATFPGWNPETDGVVINYGAVGRVGTLFQNYNKGRTATHEIGHWLNLRHIWGDTECGNDFVGDTPLHNGPNYRCPDPGATSTCTGNPVMMWMNYMDYTYDGCMYMFSNGQKDRMLAVVAPDGPRSSLAD